MITLAVAAILLALAVPSFSGVLASNRLVGQSNALVSALQIARSEAVRRNSHAILCRSANLTTCTAGASWTGWIMGLDNDNNNVIDEILKVGNIKAPVQVIQSQKFGTINNSLLIFRPDGFARDANDALFDGSLAVCLQTTKPQLNVRAVSISAGSRIATKSLDGGGNCIAPNDIP